MEDIKAGLKFILVEMCRRVNVAYCKMDFKKPGWFSEYSWTAREQDKFRDWLADYIFTNTKARHALATFTHKNKRMCKKFADDFIFGYGWSVK